jgi:hypothetical protein
LHLPLNQPLGSQLKEFRHGLKVPIGVIHMDVPQVGGQLGEFPFDVEPGAIPVDQGAGAEPFERGELLSLAKEFLNLFVTIDVRGLAAVAMREKPYGGNLGARVDGALPKGEAPDHP